MPTTLPYELLPSAHNRYNLPVDVITQGHTLTNANLAVIHNLITDISQEKLALKFDPNNVMNFAQQEAALAGQLLILQYILDCHDAAVSPSQELN